jgi:hypothetical protein
MRLIAVIVLLVLSIGETSAQLTDVSSLKKRIRVDVKAETRNSFANTEYVFFWGVKLGLDLDRKVKFGFGYSWLQSRYFSNLFDPDDFPSTTQKAQPRFRIWSAYAEYEFYRDGGWEFSAPVELGFGNSFYQNDQQKKIGKGMNMVTMFGLNTSYMFSKWVGFGVGLGYRIVLLENKEMKDQFTSPYYQVKLKLKLGNLVNKIRKKRSKGR